MGRGSGYLGSYVKDLIPSPATRYQPRSWLPASFRMLGMAMRHRTSAANRRSDCDLWIPPLRFQGHMRIRLRCISWQWLLGIERIPIGRAIRNLLDGCPVEAFADFFVQSLSTHRNHKAFAPCGHLGDRFPVVLDGSQCHRWNTLRHAARSARKAG